LAFGVAFLKKCDTMQINKEQRRCDQWLTKLVMIALNAVLVKQIAP
jgi:hypothetical protein